MNYGAVNLGRIDLNKNEYPLTIKTYWCRIADDAPVILNHNRHNHSFFEMHFCTHGECEFKVGDRIIRIYPDDYVLIPPNIDHKLIYATSEYEKLVWGFSLDDEKLTQQLKQNCLKELPRRASKEMLYALEQTVNEANRADYRALDMIKINLYSLFIFVIRQLTELKNESKISKESYAIIDEMKDFLSENLSCKIGLKECAGWLYISERQLERICISEVGMHFGDIKRQIQHDKLCELLGGSHLSLSETAYAAGFSDEYSMGKFFKRTEGISPGKYRKLIKGKCQK